MSNRKKIKMNEPTDDEVRDLLARAEKARVEIHQRALDLLEEAVAVLTKDHGFTKEEALDTIALQALEKAILYIQILPDDARAAVKDIPMLVVPEKV